MTDVFDRIYRTNAWAGVESMSGPGSGAAATRLIGPIVVQLVADLGITSVLDVGCGDGYWMPTVPGYVGIEVSTEAIRRARLNHPDRDYRLAGVWDIRPATFDLVICRDAFQHMSFAHGLSTLNGIRATRARYLLASTFDGGENVDIETGDAYSPDLTAPPFGLGEPERRIFDGWDYQLGTLIRDPRKHLGLWRLSAV